MRCCSVALNKVDYSELEKSVHFHAKKDNIQCEEVLFVYKKKFKSLLLEIYWDFLLYLPFSCTSSRGQVCATKPVCSLEKIQCGIHQACPILVEKEKKKKKRKSYSVVFFSENYVSFFLFGLGFFGFFKEKNEKN